MLHTEIKQAICRALSQPSNAVIVQDHAAAITFLQ